MRHIINKQIELFKQYLISEEKAALTIEKYIRDITTFQRWLGDSNVSREKIIEYKTHLSKHYATSSVNSILSSLTSFFIFLGWSDLKVRLIKVQRNIFESNNKELTKGEYYKILSAAKVNGNERLYLILQTICSTGIRVSELRQITVESVTLGKAEINCKGKRRMVFIPDKLCKILRKYINARQIKSGPIFVTRNGKPLDRSNIWSDMKKLCDISGVPSVKVFPHNLRHLFARTYYSKQKDIVRLADILGHSSVNTTRIYTIESGETHRQHLQHLGLLLC